MEGNAIHQEQPIVRISLLVEDVLLTTTEGCIECVITYVNFGGVNVNVFDDGPCDLIVALLLKIVKDLVQVRYQQIK